MVKHNVTQSKKICQAEGCTEAYVAKGFCHKHYQQMRRLGKAALTLTRLKELLVNLCWGCGITWSVIWCCKVFCHSP